MIYLFNGKDTFSRKKVIDELKAAVGDLESRDANTTVLPANGLTLGHLLAACNTIPFLAERRLVIVEGLLEEFNERAARGAAARSGSRKATDPAEWEGLGDAVKAMPSSTDLVFLDENVTLRNPLLTMLKPLATIRQFDPPPVDQLRRWLMEQAQAHGTPLTDSAQMVLLDMIGPDLWRLDTELSKLSLYATGRSITEQDVAALVSSTREVSIFSAVDAVVERNLSAALRNIQALLHGEETVSHILFMLARQVRLLILAQELQRSGVAQQEMGSRLGILQEFPLRKTLEQARRYPWAELLRFHTLLLETDIAIKSGAMEETTALEVLIAEVCSPNTPIIRSTMPS